MNKIIGVGDFKFSYFDKKYINSVINSNQISCGEFSEKFEREFAKLHGCKYAVFCNSGTSALHIALAALKEKYKWDDWDEVIVPATTFVATANIVIHNNMTPIFVDVDNRTYNINHRLIEMAITPRTRAIIPVHLMGLPADMGPIIKIAKKWNLKIIEDSCETVFAKYHGKSVGSMGDIGCFSTYMAHYIVTGAGGLATTNNADLAERLRSLMNHGRDMTVRKHFRFLSLGHSFRATEFEAALGLAQLKKYKDIINARRKVARDLTYGLNDLCSVIQLPFVPEGQEHMFMLYPLVLLHGDNGGIMRYLDRRRIETRELMPLISQPVYKKYPWIIKQFNTVGKLEENFPVATWLNRSGFYIGCHQYMSNADVKRVVCAIRGYFKR